MAVVRNAKRKGKVRKSSAGPNPLRVDPTRTVTLRLAAVRAVRRKFALLRGKIVQLVVGEDAFGLKPSPLRLNVENCRPGQIREAGGKCGPGIGLEVPRSEMPQIRGEDMEEFLRYVRSRGVSLLRKTVPADELNPTQREFRQERVDAIPEVKLRDPILVSEDLYVLDGTHRWVKHWQRGRKSEVPVTVVGLDLRPALELMRDFPKAKFVENVFCATGPGGGVDPTCSSGGSKNSLVAKVTAGLTSSKSDRGKFVKHAESAKAILSRMTPKAAAAADAGVDKIKYLAGPSELAAEVAKDAKKKLGGGVIGWLTSKIVQFKSSTSLGLYHGTLKTMYLTSSVDTSGTSYDTIQAVHAHEFGHAIGEGSGLHSSKEWQIVWKDEFKDRSEFGILGPYSQTHYKEGFAEVARVYYGGMPDHYREMFEQQYPRTAALWKREGLAPAPSPRQGSRIRRNQEFILPQVFESGVVLDDVCLDAVVNLTTNAGRFAFHSTPQKVEEFQRWLRGQFASTLLGQSDEELWARFAEQGFRRGAGRAFDDVNRSRRFGPRQGEFYEGSRDQFLRSSFGRPESVDKLKLLAGRSFTDLRNVTDDMATRMSRTLMDGLARGSNPRDLASGLMEDLDVSQARAETIAQTEIVRAHNEGQLDSMEQLGVEEVGVVVEYSTAAGAGASESEMDAVRVCPRCQHLSGVVLKVAEAHGVIPVHPRCRCSWTPANVGEDQSRQKRSKGDIDQALEAAEVDGVEVDEDRPQPLVSPAKVTKNSVPITDALKAFSRLVCGAMTENAFCPTGPGGGVDPTCSPGGVHAQSGLPVGKVFTKQYKGSTYKAGHSLRLTSPQQRPLLRQPPNPRLLPHSTVPYNSAGGPRES